MSRRQEICRDFQRGSCRYGTRCKFLHQAGNQQQQKQPQQNQGQRNAFGGSGVSNYYGALANNSISQRPTHNNQSQQSAREHKCNDPRLCKDQIKEDFQNEHPVFWRLTCYAHYKYLPNDVVGDVSPEELRALAYEGAKQGLSLKDVAQREASMVAAKNAEFEALLRNSYNGPASQGSAAPFPSVFASPLPQNSSTVMVFGQPLTLSNMTPAGPGFGQTPSPFGGSAATGFRFGQPSGDVTFGSRPSTINVLQQSPFMSTASPGPQLNAFQQSPFASSASSGPVTAPVASGNFTAPGFDSAFAAGNMTDSAFESAFASFASNPGPTTGFGTPQGNSVALSPIPASSLSNTTAVTDISASGEEDAKWYKDSWKIGEVVWTQFLHIRLQFCHVEAFVR